MEWLVIRLLRRVLTIGLSRCVGCRVLLLKLRMHLQSLGIVAIVIMNWLVGCVAAYWIAIIAATRSKAECTSCSLRRRLSLRYKRVIEYVLIGAELLVYHVWCMLSRWCHARFRWRFRPRHVLPTVIVDHFLWVHLLHLCANLIEGIEGTEIVYSWHLTWWTGTKLISFLRVHLLNA